MLVSTGRMPPRSPVVGRMALGGESGEKSIDFTRLCKDAAAGKWSYL